MKFVLIKDPYHDPYWMALISTQQELVDWYKYQPHARDGAADIFRNVTKGSHATTAIGHYFEFKKRFGLPLPGAIGLAEIMSEMLYEPKAYALLEGPILINAYGSFCGLDDGYHEIIDEREGSYDEWPGIDIKQEAKYMQWEGGKHWYAKIGPLDVVVDGRQKWNTKRQAEKAVRRFLTERANAQAS